MFSEATYYPDPFWQKAGNLKKIQKILNYVFYQIIMLTTIIRQLFRINNRNMLLTYLRCGLYF